MKIAFLSLLFLFFANTALAQADSEAGADKTEDEESLDIFDGDVENTQLGWSQLSVSLGYMPLSGDGTWEMELPGGQQVTMLDLDRLGLDDDDTSYWLTVNWRNHDSRWGAWFAAWQYDVAGYRVWERNLEIGDDLIVPVGAGIVSELDAKWYILEATYGFARTKNFDAGIGFGLHAVDLDTRLAAHRSHGVVRPEL